MRWGGAGSGSRTPRAVERHARRGDRRVAEQCVGAELCNIVLSKSAAVFSSSHIRHHPTRSTLARLALPLRCPVLPSCRVVTP